MRGGADSVLLEVTTRGALAGTAIVGFAFALSFWMSRAPLALAVVGALASVAGLAALVWAAWPARQMPSDRSVARYIEERTPALDERLVSAVDVANTPDAAVRPALAAAMVRDAARAAADVDPSTIVPAEAIRRRALRAAAACAILLGMLFVSRHAARQALDAVALTLFPSRITLEVTPGNTRVQAGSGLTVEARLVGNTAPVVAQLLRAVTGSDEWQPAEMETDASGQFRLALDVAHQFVPVQSAGGRRRAPPCSTSRWCVRRGWRASTSSTTTRQRSVSRRASRRMAATSTVPKARASR